jgi:signal transduction histidine kinase
MPARRSPVLVVAALVAVTVALVCASVAIKLGTAGDQSVSGFFVVAIAVGFAGAGAVIALQRPDNPIGWIFLATGVTAGLGLLSGAYANSWLQDRAGPDLLGKAAACYGTASWIPFVLLPSTFLLLLFPDGRPPSPRWRLVGWGAAVGIVASFAGALMLPGPLEDYPELRNPLAVEGGLADALQGIGWLGIAVGVFGSVAALVLRFRRATGDARDQLKWLAYAAAIVAVTISVSVVLYDVVGATAANIAIMTSILALPVATGIAILRHRLYDIDVVISRTLGYAVLTAGLAAAYVAVSLGLGMVAGSGSTLPTAAGTLAVALAFRPLRGWIQRRVDRRFDRNRYEGLRKVERFLEDLRAGRAAPEATGAVLADALHDPSLELYFWFPETGEYVDADGRVVTDPAAAGRALTPVRRGTLQLACVAHDPALDARPNLLTSVIAAAGLAIEVERLRVEVRRRLAEVEQSRARIVTVGDEERRRLERDLHDGAQQRLVSLGLALRDIQSRLPDASDAARELDTTVDELADAIDELRELARGVRPAGLDDGLAAALRELTARSSLRTRVEATDERFDDSIETAAYFVCSEALANTTKHARATEVSVRAARRNGCLTVRIRDDGIGGASLAGGSGLLGLSDRVAALGGTVTIESAPGKGTTVTAELPCGS